MFPALAVGVLVEAGGWFSRFFFPLLVPVDTGSEEVLSFFSLFEDMAFEADASVGCCCFWSSSCSLVSFACSAAFLAASSFLTCQILTFGGPGGALV